MKNRGVSNIGIKTILNAYSLVVTQADETFVGGKTKNKHADKRVPNNTERNTKDKTVVFGMVNNAYRVYTSVVPDTKATTLKPIIKDMVAQGSIVITDEWRAIM